ncbi:MAG: ECF transporter S component [Ruthenibacterium sp.]
MKNQKTLRLTQLAFLVALELLMTYTPLGYLSVPGLTITFLMVPVTLGAMLLGPLAGAVLGGVFGLTSFAQCFGASPFGAALLGIHPALAFITCVVPRVLAGLLTALVFRALLHLPHGGDRSRGAAVAVPASEAARADSGAMAGTGAAAAAKPAHKNAPFFLAALSGSVGNTVFFMATLILCFYGTPYIQSLAQSMGAANPLTFVALFVGVQGLVEAAVCCALSGILCRVLYPILQRQRMLVQTDASHKGDTANGDGKPQR